MMSKPALRIHNLIQPQTHLYALVDAAAVDNLSLQQEQQGKNHCFCLLQGSLGEALAGVAPHLIMLDNKTHFTRFYQNIGDLSAALLLESPATPDELLAHFRSHLMVGAFPLGSALHFRFYDASVLEPWLRHCPGPELETFFGPVTRFIFQKEKTLASWSLGPRGGLVCKELGFEPP